MVLLFLIKKMVDTCNLNFSFFHFDSRGCNSYIIKVRG